MDNTGAVSLGAGGELGQSAGNQCRSGGLAMHDRMRMPPEHPVEMTASVPPELGPFISWSAEPQVVGAVSAEPQVFGPAPFSMAMGPERIWGTFNLTRQEEADEMIKRITAMKAFLKPE